MGLTSSHEPNIDMLNLLHDQLITRIFELVCDETDWKRAYRLQNDFDYETEAHKCRSPPNIFDSVTSKQIAEEREANDVFNELPDELLVKVFEFSAFKPRLTFKYLKPEPFELNLKHLRGLRLVCRRWDDLLCSFFNVAEVLLHVELIRRGRTIEYCTYGSQKRRAVYHDDLEALLQYTSTSFKKEIAVNININKVAQCDRNATVDSRFIAQIVKVVKQIKSLKRVQIICTEFRASFAEIDRLFCSLTSRETLRTIHFWIPRLTEGLYRIVERYVLEHQHLMGVDVMVTKWNKRTRELQTAIIQHMNVIKPDNNRLLMIQREKRLHVFTVEGADYDDE